jgi:excisionase family DNA binding protein
MPQTDQGDRQILTPAEVAELFAVGPRTVSRWARLGWIECITTPGGRRRFRRAEVERILAGHPEDAA